MSMETGTLKLTPTGYDADASVFSSITSGYEIERSYADSSSSTDTRFNGKTGSRAEIYVMYTFTIPSLPNNTIIDSITCYAKSKVSNVSYLPTSNVQLYAGSTAKGTATDSASTTAQAREIDAGNSWTVSEVRNIRLRFYAQRGTSNTTRSVYLSVYGADLTINYTIDDTLHDAIHIKVNGDWKEVGKIYTKTNGTWEEVSKASKKENGSWVEKDNLAIFDENALFLKGD